MLFTKAISYHQFKLLTREETNIIPSHNHHSSQEQIQAEANESPIFINLCYFIASITCYLLGSFKY